MKRPSEEAGLAAILLAASLVLAAITPFQVTGGEIWGIGSATLPIALAVAIALLAAWLLVDALRNQRPAEEPRQRSWPIPVMTLGLVAYIAALPWLGFYLSTVLLVGGLARLFGEGRILAILVLALAVPAVLLVFFERFMIILLPAAAWN
ncbi:MAG: tripartite tricarboxylate transporter TctB family protein [Alphaproteobacteria bacterium]|nr:tripartite tricarboxylate transporter TctB family protein [Alphaproteobacteria bacterium]